MAKIVILLVVIAAVMLGAAFLAPQDANGKLFSVANMSDAFSLDGLKERLVRMTPGYVFTVTADTATSAAGKVLGATTKTLGPVIDLTRNPGESAKKAAGEAADTFIPQTKEEKRIELIGTLEARIAELEQNTEAQDESVKTLTQEIEELVKELKAVREDGGLIDAAIEGTKKTLAPQDDACECSVE